MTLVDRSIDPVVHLQYEVPFDDICEAPSVPNERTHDFVAFCRDHAPSEPRPMWITSADAVESEPLYGPIEPEDVLETSTSWADCWSPLDDVGRRPITTEQASEGVDWDTSSLAPGNYVIAGYTYEPPYNVWRQHDGAFKVHDGDPAALGPAIALVQTRIILYRDELVEIEGCVDAVDGSRLVLSWAPATRDAQWEPLSTIDVHDATFAASFPSLEQWWGEETYLRVEVVDPMDRRSVAYLSEEIIVINADKPTDTTGLDSGAPDGTSDSGAQGESSGSAAAPLREPSGCGCTTAQRDRPLGVLPLFAVLGLRRGRRSPHGAPCRSDGRRPGR